MKIVAWIMIAASALSVIAGSFLIGKERAPDTAAKYLIDNLAPSACTVVLAGRVMGWW